MASPERAKKDAEPAKRLPSTTAQQDVQNRDIERPQPNSPRGPSFLNTVLNPAGTHNDGYALTQRDRERMGRSQARNNAIVDEKSPPATPPQPPPTTTDEGLASKKGAFPPPPPLSTLPSQHSLQATPAAQEALGTPDSSVRPAIKERRLSTEAAKQGVGRLDLSKVGFGGGEMPQKADSMAVTPGYEREMAEARMAAKSLVGLVSVKGVGTPSASSMGTKLSPLQAGNGSTIAADGENGMKMPGGTLRGSQGTPARSLFAAEGQNSAKKQKIEPPTSPSAPRERKQTPKAIALEEEAHLRHLQHKDHLRRKQDYQKRIVEVKRAAHSNGVRMKDVEKGNVIQKIMQTYTSNPDRSAWLATGETTRPHRLNSNQADASHTALSPSPLLFEPTLTDRQSSVDTIYGSEDTESNSWYSLSSETRAMCDIDPDGGLRAPEPTELDEHRAEVLYLLKVLPVNRLIEGWADKSQDE